MNKTAGFNNFVRNPKNHPWRDLNKGWKIIKLKSSFVENKIKTINLAFLQLKFKLLVKKIKNTTFI